jgi:large subunit ribosomal protein L40e
MLSSKYFVKIPTSGGGDAAGRSYEKNYDHEGYRIHGSVEDTKLSTNKQLSLIKEGEMDIYIMNIMNKMITLQVLPSDTIDVVKKKIQDQENIPKDKQQLYYAHMKLDDSYTLKHYNIHKLSTLRLY